MDAYDYEKVVREDVMNWLDENADRIAKGPFGEVNYDDVYDEMMDDDSVTGNASGSYTFNTWTAEEYLCHNFGLLSEAIEDMGGDADKALRSPEDADVMIRCHVLGQVLQECLDEWNTQHAKCVDEYAEDRDEE